MPSLYYFAAWTDSECLLGCEHSHETIISAVACCTSAGAYVIAVENGELRELNDSEELEFQRAMYGNNIRYEYLLSAAFSLAFLAHFAGR